MDRINHASAIDIGGGRRGFRSKDTVAGMRGTVVTATHMNSQQEELMALIEYSGLDPNAADLEQIVNAVRSQRLNYALAGGDPNNLFIGLNPVPASWDALRHVPLFVRCQGVNLGIPTLSVAGLLGNRTIRARGTMFAAPPGTLYPGSVAILMYDGFSVEMLNSDRPATTSFVVNQATGLDTNPGDLSLPLKSITECLRRTAVGGITYISLITNYAHDEVTGLRGRRVVIQGRSADLVSLQNRTLYFIPDPKAAALQDPQFRDTANYPNNTSAFVLNAGSSWQSNSITYNRGAVSGATQLNSAHFIADGLASADFIGGELQSPPAGVNTVWFASVLNRFSISFGSVAVSGDTSGKIYTTYLGGSPLAAGANPNSVWQFSTNVTSS